MTPEQSDAGGQRKGQSRLRGEPVDPDSCATNQNHYWQYCVNCGTQLQSRKCKLFCPTCGYYHSCSEP